MSPRTLVEHPEDSSITSPSVYSKLESDTRKETRQPPDNSPQCDLPRINLIKQREQSAEIGAAWFSRLVFQWVSKLLLRGYRRPLQLQDIPQIHPDRRAQFIAVKVQDIFKKNCQRRYKFSLFWALYEVFKKEFWIGGICRGLADVLLITTPYTLRYLIQFAMDSYKAHLVGERGPPLWHGMAYLGGIIGMLVIQSFTHNHYMYLLGVIGGQTRAVLTSAIFDKSMQVIGRGTPIEHNNNEEDEYSEDSSDKIQLQKKRGREDWSTSHLTAFLSVDCSRIAQTASALHILWTAPLSLTIAISLLIVNLHLSALAGFGLLVLGFGGLVVAVGVLFRQRKANERITESRVSLTHEVLDAIRPVKFFGWGDGFAQQMSQLRREETLMLRYYTAVKNAVGAVSQGLPVLTAMISFITFALTHSGLSPATVFSSTALFTSLRMPLIYLPMCIQACIDSAASLLRIQEFLLTKEIEENTIDPVLDAAIEVNHATFVWDEDDEDSAGVEPEQGATAIMIPTSDPRKSGFRLHDINVTIQRGELLAIIGSVGSGKTSLLSALAGDMARVSGSVVWGASHALCPQQPWMWNGTVRENIIFGREFERPWYSAVLQACSLARDLELLPHGDQTIVGERGVVLSGGQKQRISLARAMYSGKEVVILDDPLSAVDANVGSAIMDDVICGYLSTRTRILCTHNMSILNRCDRILWLENGRVRALGTYQDLLRIDLEFSNLVQEPGDSVNKEQHTSSKLTKNDQSGAKQREETNDNTQNKDTKLIQDEDQATRSVSWSVYRSLFASPNSLLFAILCIPMLVAGSGCMVLTQLWLAWWSSVRFGIEEKVYIAIYVALGCGQVLFLYLFGTLLALCCTRASQVMLNKALLRVLHAPIWFFDTTPVGRLMNRFSSDVEAMDYHLPEAMRMFCISMFGLAAIFGLIIYYFHWFGIAVGTLLVILVFLAFFYRATAREIKRHESSLRSVVYTRFLEGLSGASTLRAYGMHPNLSNNLCEAADEMNSASFTTVAVQRWLSLRQDAATILLVLVMGILVLQARHHQNPSISGLVLSLMLSAVQVIQVVVREWADVESAMNSTERLYEYANNIPQEMDDTFDPPAEDWPKEGEVIFSETRMRYRPGLPEALKGVNLRIRGGEHVAIVGRTGAGKSSIVNGLFRLTELSDGAIFIDGSDISQVPLQDLRGDALSIIPQETSLFSGTVRSNLDPFDELADSTIWEALKSAGLANTLHPSDTIYDQGANLSMGQQQLLALARVMTRNSRIVVCDEATAALDAETDDHIQRTMRRAFRNRTVLCIAHRLRTVLWYDRICVMDAGQVAELDTPLQLFRQNDGIFREMCLKLGITEQQIVHATEIAHADDRAPLLELNLPDPGFDVDFESLRLPTTEERRTKPRLRSRPPIRRRARSGVGRKEDSVQSWVVWESVLGRESMVGGLDERDDFRRSRHEL
ncbi:P-loop containing nucleoside triphosphate hydrolase protein [Lojkania enalia]|uniref:P-loop containing nucleoside triphosphate hydrolase protein n=1 Tax=Lojkania enalia TaxID=147567 RepID=A0A9P4KJB6_9PLEO|nr:P-loop containing nucleoside triphosphate hydrolase protein [Didymosphaeria enalia]